MQVSKQQAARVANIAQPEIKFQASSLQEIANFPRARLIDLLQKTILEHGEEFCKFSYEVVVGQEGDHIPRGFHWKKWQPGQIGYGFTFGAYTEDNVSYKGRHYSLKCFNPAFCIESFVEGVKPKTTTGKVIKMAKRDHHVFPPKLQTLMENQERAQRFMELCSDVCRKNNNRIWHNLAHQAFRDAFGEEYTTQAIGQFLLQMSKAGLLQSLHKPGSRQSAVYGFGPKAADFLPDGLKALAPRTVDSGSISDSPTLAAMQKDEGEEKIRELLVAAQLWQQRAEKAEAENVQLKARTTSTASDEKVQADTAELYAMFEQATDEADLARLSLADMTAERDDLQKQLTTALHERDTARAEAAAAAVPDTSAITSDLLARAKARLASK